MLRSLLYNNNNLWKYNKIYINKKINKYISMNTFNANNNKIGFIGLGHMGSKMAKHLSDNNYSLLVFDKLEQNMKNLENYNNINIKLSSIENIAKNCNIVFSMLPNDIIVNNVSLELLEHIKNNKKINSDNKFIHISCSTISPKTSRNLAELYNNNNNSCIYISAPVFARPDGISRKEATWMISGDKYGKEIASKLLLLMGKIYDYGDDAGAANVVKLCGNFLIASSIESIGEAMTLAEKNGVEPKSVMNLLSSTIFDCLIYKGYGQRVSHRDHRPGGFSLDLGLKDVSLVNSVARDVNTPMPFLSILLDRFISAKAKSRGDFDWSAIGLNIAEDAGIDISKDIERTKKDIKENNTY